MMSYMGKTFGELFKQTMNKIDKIKAQGYNLVDVWEHELYPQRFGG